MTELLVSAAVFTGLVMLLVLVILASRALLVPSGEVGLMVNGTRDVSAPVGRKLLGVLAEEGIHLPAACGGKGSCGLCRVRVTSGGGSALPTEEAVLTDAGLRRGERLACQVTVRQDLEVWVPEEILGVRVLDVSVRSTRWVATLIKEVVLELPEGAEFPFRTGSFVQVEAPPYRLSYRDLEVPPHLRPEWDRLGLGELEAGTDRPVSRAYSLANHQGEPGILMLVVRLAVPPPGAPPGVPPGVVSSYVCGLKVGDAVTVSGPYGHFFTKESEREMVFVGGGAGMAPMRAHVHDQLERLRTSRRISFWYGARTLNDLFYVEEFDRLDREHPNFRWSAALSDPRPEDEWDGPTGFIHEHLYDTYLKDHPAPAECEYYLCGPPLMIKAVTGMLRELGVEERDVLYDDFGS